MPRSLKQGILGASTILLSKDIDKYAFICGSNFNETDVTCLLSKQTADSNKKQTGILGAFQHTFRFSCFGKTFKKDLFL